MRPDIGKATFCTKFGCMKFGRGFLRECEALNAILSLRSIGRPSGAAPHYRETLSEPCGGHPICRQCLGAGGALWETPDALSLADQWGSVHRVRRRGERP